MPAKRSVEFECQGTTSLSGRKPKRLTGLPISLVFAIATVVYQIFGEIFGAEWLRFLYVYIAAVTLDKLLRISIYLARYFYTPYTPP